MINGFKNNNGKIETIVVSAKLVVEFEEFKDSLSSLEHTTTTKIPNFIERFMNKDLSDFQHDVIVIEHSSEEEQELFLKKYNVVLIRAVNASASQDKMFENQQTKDTNSIRIYDKYNLAELDDRSQQERDEDNAFNDAMEKAIAAGNISGDSFGDDEKEDVKVTDINSENKNGVVRIKDVLAKKWGGEVDKDKEEDDNTFIPSTAEELRNALGNNWCAALDIWHEGKKDEPKEKEVKEDVLPNTAVAQAEVEEQKLPPHTDHIHRQASERDLRVLPKEVRDVLNKDREHDLEDVFVSIYSPHNILNGELYAIPLSSGEQSFEVVEAFNVEQSHSISLKYATTMFVKKTKKEENGYIIFYSKYSDETLVVVL